jgi:hypothetical protein
MVDKKINYDKNVLKIAETNPKFVGRGVALIDPRIMEEMQLSTGDRDLWKEEDICSIMVWTIY